MIMQNRIRMTEDRWSSFLDGIKSGKSLKFGQDSFLKRFSERDGLDQLRSEERMGVRRPRVALVSFFFDN